ncbi:hypothetical protein ACKFKG_23975 [Phormidesmis sp. 146-35]
MKLTPVSVELNCKQKFTAICAIERPITKTLQQFVRSDLSSFWFTVQPMKSFFQFSLAPVLT